MVRPGVFFSGDGGLKYIIVKQLQNSGEYKKILSDHPQWVKEIWDQGYYPFQPAFVYNVNDDHLVTFPPFFQLINSYLYKYFGFYGIYIIPALSVLLIWLCFFRTLSVLKIRAGSIAFGIALLAFCSPLAMYGAIYWEHSLAAFLVFAGVIYFVRQKSSLSLALLSGLLCGGAIWFREETVVFSGMLIAAIAWNNRKARQKTDIIFVTAAVITSASYFIVNYFVFDTFFGVHGYQVMRDATLQSQLFKGAKQVFKINRFNLLNFPLIVFCGFILLNQYKKRKEGVDRFFQLNLIISLYLVLMPFVVPSDGDKQWGARFFLPVVPPAILVITSFIDKLNWRINWSRYKLVTASCAIVVLYCLYVNVYKAGSYLHKDYSTRVYPALKYIETESCDNIVIDNQFIAQELTVKFNTKNFFLVSKEDQLRGLMEKLKKAGQPVCLFISIDKKKTAFPDVIVKNPNVIWQQVGSYSVGRYVLPSENVEQAAYINQ
jgi:hypothetical protein